MVLTEQVPMGVRAFGRELAGLGVVVFDGATWSLTMVSPAGGVALFSAGGPPKTVTAAVATWEPWLRRMPLERDLRLVFTPATETCDAGPGRIHVRETDGGWVRRWCGEGGAARAVLEEGVVTVFGTGYRLRVVLPVAAPAG